MCHKSHLLHNITPLQTPRIFHTADKTTHTSYFTGSLVLRGFPDPIIIHNVHYLPNFGYTLISSHKLTNDLNVLILQDTERAYLLKVSEGASGVLPNLSDCQIVATAPLHSSLQLFTFDLVKPSESFSPATSPAFSPAGTLQAFCSNPSSGTPLPILIDDMEAIPSLVTGQDVHQQNTIAQVAELLHYKLGHSGWSSILRNLNELDKFIPKSINVGSLKHYIRTTMSNGDCSLSPTAPCTICGAARGIRLPSPKISHVNPPRTKLDRVYADIKGPIDTAIPDQFAELFGYPRYCSIIVDGLTGYIWARAVGTKGQAKDHIIEWAPLAMRQANSKIHTLITDGGGEYNSSELQVFLQCVELISTTLHTSYDNGKAETGFRSLFNIMRALLMHGRLPLFLWAYALAQAVYIVNIKIRNGSDKSPFERWHGIKPNLSHLHVFGCDVLYHKTQDANKLDSLEERSLPGIYLGASHKHTNGHIIWDPIAKKILIRRCVRFFDNSFEQSAKHLSTMTNGGIDYNSAFNVFKEAEKQFNQVTFPSSSSSSSSGSVSSNASVHHDDKLAPSPPPPPFSTKSGRKVSRPNRLGMVDYEKELYYEDTRDLHELSDSIPSLFLNEIKYDTTLSSSSLYETFSNPSNRHDKTPYSTSLPCLANISGKSHNIDTPSNWTQAVSSTHATEWIKAAEKELSAIISHGTLKYQRRDELPEGSKILKTRWVFKVKPDERGNVAVFKARAVVCGYDQRPGIDFHETFAPTIKHRSLRLVEAMVADLGYESIHTDVSNAFLNGNVQESLYIEQLEGLPSKEYPPAQYVCKLERALYGIKQAPREWYLVLSDYLRDTLKLIPCKTDPCVLIKNSSTERRIIVTLYVDDCTFNYSPVDRIEGENIIKQFEGRFKVTNNGPTSHLLGMRCTRDRDANGNYTNMKLDLQSYIEKALDTIGKDLTQGTRVIPINQDVRLSADPTPSWHEKSKVTPHKYQSLVDADHKPLPHADFRQVVGTLLYASLTCRPDICFITQQLAMFAHNPKLHHWLAVKDIFQYLRHTKHYSLLLRRSHADVPMKDYKPKLTAYTDSDYAGCRDTRRSTTGYAIFVDSNIVSWSTKRQPTVALSSAEAEYMAASDVTKELLFTKHLLEEIIGHEVDCAEVRCDNTATVQAISNGNMNTNMRHIDTRLHFIRDYVQNQTINITHVRSANNIADLFTKALGKDVFNRHVNQFMQTNNVSIN